MVCGQVVARAVAVAKVEAQVVLPSLMRREWKWTGVVRRPSGEWSRKQVTG